MIKLSNITDVGEYLNGISGVIFDLDDTLYGEKQYVYSGYVKIEEFLNIPNAADELWSFFKAGKAAVDEYLNQIGRPDLKNECLAVYRSQFPDIRFYDGVPEMLARIRDDGKRLGIITDGRVEGQKNKIAALGLEKLVDDIIVTDELGGVEFRKPNKTAFTIMQNKWQLPFERLVYIGDNIAKDFIAPVELGMKYIWFCNPDGLYFKKN